MTTNEMLVEDKNGRPYKIKRALWVDASRYSGRLLKKITDERGVGRPPLMFRKKLPEIAEAA